MNHHDHGAAASDFFDEKAATWDDADKVARAERIAALILSNVDLPASASALDVGAGTGLNAWPLADRLDHLTLADASSGMLAVARERIATRPDAAKFSVRQLDLATDALEPGAFDLIYAVMSLHHVNPLEPALATLANALAPGGTLAIADLDAEDGHYHSGQEFTGHDGFDRTWLTERLHAAGLTRVRFLDAMRLPREIDGDVREYGVFLALASR